MIPFSKRDDDSERRLRRLLVLRTDFPSKTAASRTTFLELLSQASDDLYTKIADLNDQLNYYNNIINTLVNEKVLNDKQAKCIFILCQNRLFDDTYMNMNTLTELLEKSDTTTRKILKSLESKNLLVKSRNKNQYLYSANLDSLSSQNFTKCFD